MPGQPISGRSGGAGPTATPDPAEHRAGAGATVTSNRRAESFGAQPARESDVNGPMRPRTIQVIAALVAAVAFILAFIAAGAVLVSSLFMLVGLLAVGWLALSLVGRVKLWGEIQRIRERRRKTVA